MTQKRGGLAKALDEIDDDLTSRRGSMTAKRSGSTPATKGNQDIDDRKEANKGEVKPLGGGEQESPEGVKRHKPNTPSKACTHCGKG